MLNTNNNKTSRLQLAPLVAAIVMLSGCNSINPLDGLMERASDKVEDKAKEVASDAFDDLKDSVSDKAEGLRDDAVDKVKKLADSDFGEYSDDSNDVITASSGTVNTANIATKYGYTVDNATSIEDMNSLKNSGITASYTGGYAASSHSLVNGTAGEKQHDYKGDMTLQADFGAGWIAGRTSELVDGQYNSGKGVQINGAIDGNQFAGSSNIYDVNTGNVTGTGSSVGAFAGSKADQVVGAFETVGTMDGTASVVQGGFGAEKQATD